MDIIKRKNDNICKGGIVADSMGLGKTAQMCVFVSHWNRERISAIR
jgi:SNF2 family DNA or RNA helicase